MIIPWDPAGAGVVRLPSGRLVRGRSLRRPPPPGPGPTLTVYLLGQPPPTGCGQARWVRWPDFWLPANPAQARKVLVEAWEIALTERVEIACRGGRGRTGTALACLAVIDGVPPRQAVAFVRRQYSPHAVETPWQKRYVRRFPAPRRQHLIVHPTRGHAATGRSIQAPGLATRLGSSDPSGRSSSLPLRPHASAP